MKDVRPTDFRSNHSTPSKLMENLRFVLSSSSLTHKTSLMNVQSSRPYGVDENDVGLLKLYIVKRIGPKLSADMPHACSFVSLFFLKTAPQLGTPSVLTMYPWKPAISV